MEIYNWHLDTVINEYWVWANALNVEECGRIIDICSELDKVKATVNQSLNESYRKTNISWIPVNDETKWIFQRCTEITKYVNSNYFNFDLTHIEGLQFTCYDDIGSYYNKHIDMMYDSSYSGTRKLTFTIQLSDPSTYDGGDLLLHLSNDPIIAKRDLGVATCFPSYTMHEVTPITRGKRYSLVGWCNGPRFK